MVGIFPPLSSNFSQIIVHVDANSSKFFAEILRDKFCLLPSMRKNLESGVAIITIYNIWYEGLLPATSPFYQYINTLYTSIDASS